MKHLSIYFFITLISVLGGCDFLKYDETTNYTEKNVFTDFDRAKQFLNNTYRQIPSGYNEVDGAMRASGSDDAEEINTQSNVQRFNDGSWSAINLVDAEWDSMYTGIRKANRFLDRFNLDNFKDRQYNNNYDQLVAQAQNYPYEARFLRVFFYFKLAKRYGGVPLITKVLTTEEVNSVKPSTYEEVINFIVSECDAIAPNLPVTYNALPNNESGRATRGAAMALKARALLYAASPLHNQSNDQQKWIAAAKAAKAIIDSSYYSLVNNYAAVIHRRNSSENIFERRLGDSNDFERANFPVGYEGADPGTAPTQNLVDSYEMQANGKSINDPASGYDPQHPYMGRDPRLKQTVIVNNSSWKNRKVQIWNGGLDGPPLRRATETGYYLKKQVIERVSLSQPNVTTTTQSWTIFRLGGVLLNYAEAMNEAYGPENPAGMGMTARQAVNKIRRRANMPDFPAGMSQSAFRQKLHNERRVEMAFEDQRFWDIRRWEIGPSTTDINGMEIIRNDDGSFTYNRKNVETRVWDDRMYLYPIPQSELYKNDNLEQNSGW